MLSPTGHEPANPTNPNIEAIAKLEHEALLRRTATERASDAITKMIGNTAFLLLQVLLVLHLERDQSQPDSRRASLRSVSFWNFGFGHLLGECCAHHLCSHQSKSHGASS